ncbi:hypothetical protein [Yoonia sp. BS5-3]|uniref:VWFA domain-containing protein n=1 Tax=Yoonia phaeophyticola TaxID=3137369 RepID=A0ABZ2V9P8_9RHOB
MARRRSSRGRRSKRKQRGGGSEWGWYLAIGLCLAIAVGIGIAASRLISASQIDEATLCHLGVQHDTTLILLDVTDPVNATQQARLEAFINREIAASPVDTMLAVGIVSEFADNWGQMFAKCKPKSGDEANAIYENPAFIMARYQEEFIDQVASTLATAFAGDTENQSPIMEAMQALVADVPEFGTSGSQAKLIIVSDMIQHSDTLSFFRGQDWADFVDSGGDRRLARNLQGVDIEILRITRAADNLPDRATIDGFWSRYFDLQGSNAPVVRSLGDL